VYLGDLRRVREWFIEPRWSKIRRKVVPSADIEHRASSIEHPLIDRTALEPLAQISQQMSLFYSKEISSTSKTSIPAGAPAAPL
jgi:hypothetical protein